MFFSSSSHGGVVWFTLTPTQTPPHKIQFPEFVSAPFDSSGVSVCPQKQTRSNVSFIFGLFCRVTLMVHADT